MTRGTGIWLLLSCRFFPSLALQSHDPSPFTTSCIPVRRDPSQEKLIAPIAVLKGKRRGGRRRKGGCWLSSEVQRGLSAFIPFPFFALLDSAALSNLVSTHLSSVLRLSFSDSPPSSPRSPSPPLSSDLKATPRRRTLPCPSTLFTFHLSLDRPPSPP